MLVCNFKIYNFLCVVCCRGDDPGRHGAGDWSGEKGAGSTHARKGGDSN